MKCITGSVISVSTQLLLFIGIACASLRGRNQLFPVRSNSGYNAIAEIRLGFKLLVASGSSNCTNVPKAILRSLL